MSTTHRRRLLKVCGITRARDLEVCLALGVDAVGLNLWPGSKRYLDDAKARALLDAFPAPSVGALRVGVFVDPDPDELLAAVRRFRLEAVQLHGDAPPERYAALGLPWIWVLRGTPALDRLDPPNPLPTWVLLDADVPGFGGEGRRTDWAWARQAVAALSPLPVWLAGGLDPSNARAALDAVQPAGLDVASGVEVGIPGVPGVPGIPGIPGIKDAQAIAAMLHICNTHRESVVTTEPPDGDTC